MDFKRECNLNIDFNDGSGSHDLKNEFNLSLVDSDFVVFPNWRNFETEQYVEKKGINILPYTTLDSFEYEITLLYSGKTIISNSVLHDFIERMFEDPNSDILKSKKVTIYNKYKGIIIKGYLVSNEIIDFKDDYSDGDCTIEFKIKFLITDPSECDFDYDPYSFIIKVKPTIINNVIQDIILPIENISNVLVYWGDGTYSYSNRHTYTDTEIHEIKIIGDFIWGNINDYALEEELISIEQWGDGQFGTFGRYSFSSCKNMVSIPTDSENLQISDAFAFFSICHSLTSIPEDLFINNGHLTSLEECFFAVPLNELPEKLLWSLPEVENIREAFRNTSIKSIPKDLLIYCQKLTNVRRTFYGCTNITSIPEELFWYCPELGTARGTFYMCTGIDSPPEHLFRANEKLVSVYELFHGCNLKSVPENLFESNKLITEFNYCFYGNTNLTNVPHDSAGYLWEREGKEGYPTAIYGDACFRNITNLINKYNIPSNWQ